MRILVTGGAGYIGSHVCKALQQAGHDVAVIDDFSTGNRTRIQQGSRLFVGSLLDAAFVESCLRAHQSEAVVHVAAKKAVEESIANPLYYYRENVLGMHSVLLAMVAAGTPNILLSSSAAVYGVVQSSPVTECSATKPSSPYGATKLICEQMIRDVAMAHEIKWSALRYFNVAGATESRLADRGENNLIPKVFRAIASGTRPQVYGDNYPTPDGTCIRDYVHVNDVADAHVAVLNRMDVAGISRIYNVGTGTGASVLDVMRAVRQVTGIDFAYDIVDARVGDPAEVIADPGLIRRELNWESRHDLLDAVESAWRAWSDIQSSSSE